MLEEVRIGCEYAVSEHNDYMQWGDVEHVRVVGPPEWGTVAERIPFTRGNWTFRGTLTVPVHVKWGGEWATHEGQIRRLDHFRETWTEYDAQLASRRLSET